MLLSITSTSSPATDLGYLLFKNPARVHGFDLSFGKATVFYPEATAERCTVCLLLEVDPIGMVRRKSGPAGDGGIFGQYVNDRPYVASSFLSVAISEVFGTAMTGRSKDRPELAMTAMPLEAHIPVLPSRGGEAQIRQLFEPLGYAVELARIPLDAEFPEWGPSRYYSVTLKGHQRLQDLLSHINVLIPVLDDEKHYWVGDDEVDKLLRRGGDWLPAHPAKEQIAHRYLKHRRRSVERACRRARELGSMDQGRLAICAFPSLAGTAIPQLLSRFCAEHPHISITLNAMHWHRMLDEVALQRADFAVSELPARADGVVAEHLGRYQAVCVVQQGHPFAKKRRVSLAHIATERFVSLGEEDEAGATVQKAFTAEGIELTWKSEVSLCESACAWVASAGGCAIVDPFAAEAWSGKLTWIPTDPPIAFDMWVLRSDVKPMTRLASAFLKVLREYVDMLAVSAADVPK
jgi:DNA-binding transcriptional LysR family regulator